MRHDPSFSMMHPISTYTAKYVRTLDVQVLYTFLDRRKGRVIDMSEYDLLSTFTRGSPRSCSLAA